MPYVRNAWYVAGWDEDVAVGTFHTITIMDEPLLIYRTDAGDLIAMEDRCCHRFAPLSKGRMEDGCNIRCMYHGLKFDPAGQCIAIPGQDKIPATAKVRTYPVVAKDSWIWVWMSDKGAADAALIPSPTMYDDSGYLRRRGDIDYNANYQLINDNLTDFSHLSFVHAESFGSTEWWAKLRPQVQVLDRGIRVSRWFSVDQQPMGTMPFGDRPTVLFQSYDYLVPGVLLMYSAFHYPKDMPADGVSWPTAPAVNMRIDSQAVTPLSDTKTRYFFLTGSRPESGGEEMADFMMHVTKLAFDEDRDMIEGQQERISQRRAREVLTTADVGPVQMRAVMRRLMKAEQGIQDGDAAAMLETVD